MKFIMKSVMFIVLGLLAASAILNYGFHFDRNSPDPKILPSVYEYLLVSGLLMFLFCFGRIARRLRLKMTVRDLGVAVSLIMIAAFWVCIRLSWLLLGHGEFMSTGSAGLLIPGKIDGVIWTYFNLLSNLFLFFISFSAASSLNLLVTLMGIGLFSLFRLVHWPASIVVIIALIIVAVSLGIVIRFGLRRVVRTISRLPGLSRTESKTEVRE